MPDADRLVSVNSEEGKKYGYARLKSKKRFGDIIVVWVYDDHQPIEGYPISHWWELPELPEDE